MTTSSISPTSPAIEALSAGVTTYRDLAARADAMCLSAGTHLSEAVPTLYALSGRFGSLASLLLDDTGPNPAETLAVVVDDIGRVGAALAGEREAMTALIQLNVVLSQRIDDLADHVRFLSAVVSNVKIEVASIVDDDLRLVGFADSIEQLAKKSVASVRAFHATHQTLVARLRRAASAQSTFMLSHGGKFAAASQEILSSLDVVSRRRKSVASIAGEIETVTRTIGVKVQACVMTLQIGDSARQRLEHVADALGLATALASGHDAQGSLAGSHLDENGETAATLVVLLQVAQATETMTDLSDGVGDIHELLGEIESAGRTLIDKGRALGGDADGTGHGFLGALEGQLASACALLEACRGSRRLVDEAAESVVLGVKDLQDMAQSISIMATDMMILGTNAVVTSYRLGTLGLPLGVIAQHLRSHAIQVTEAAAQVTPALDSVFTAARHFATGRDGQNAKTLESLSNRIAEAISIFRVGDATIVAANQVLTRDIETVNAYLAAARGEIHAFGAIDGEAAVARDALNPTTDEVADTSLPDALDRRLRACYTMEAERRVHDQAMGQDTHRSIDTTLADGLWL